MKRELALLSLAYHSEKRTLRARLHRAASAAIQILYQQGRLEHLHSMPPLKLIGKSPVSSFSNFGSVAFTTNLNRALQQIWPNFLEQVLTISYAIRIDTERIVVKVTVLGLPVRC